MGSDLAGTYGSLLIGGFVSASLSGVVIIQSLIYYKLFPEDKIGLKLLVAAIVLMDMAHSGMVWSGIWVDLISRPASIEHSDFIPLPISLSIVITASLTFLVHLFFADRIQNLSRRKWLLATPIIVLASARLGFACVTSVQMIRLKSFKRFVEVSSWTFTLGLALSSLVDIFVTVSLFFLLKDSYGTDYHRFGHIIDSLVLYTIEIGSVTCTATVVSMIFWLTMRQNLVFLGLHFVIGKLYANSLLATLNARRELRLSHRRVLNEMDASRIVREDLRLHFQNPISTINTTLEENSTGPNAQLESVRVIATYPKSVVELQDIESDLGRRP